jgi:hypothetical protein
MNNMIRQRLYKILSKKITKPDLYIIEPKDPFIPLSKLPIQTS